MRSEFPKWAKVQARDRWRYVKDPLLTSKVLTHHRWWTVPFLRLHCEKADSLSIEDPQTAVAIARSLPQLAERIRVDPSEVPYYQSDDERRSFIVYAWSVLGSIHVAASDIRRAEVCFQDAKQVLSSGRVEREAFGEFYRRYGILEFARREESVLSTWSKAIEIFQGHEALSDNLALSYLHRATATHVLTDNVESALADYGRALKLASNTPRGKRATFATVHNLSCLLVENLRGPEFMLASRVVKLATDVVRGRPNSPLKAKVRWAEAMVSARVGMNRYAEKRMLSAREMFLAAGCMYEAALVDIDLIRLCVLDGEADDAADHRDHLVALLRAHPDALETIPANWERMPSVAELDDMVQALRGAPKKIPLGR